MVPWNVFFLIQKGVHRHVVELLSKGLLGSQHKGVILFMHFLCPLSHFEDGREMPRTSWYAHIHIFGQFRVSTPPDLHTLMEQAKAPTWTDWGANGTQQILLAVCKLPRCHLKLVVGRAGYRLKYFNTCANTLPGFWYRYKTDTFEQ